VVWQGLVAGTVGAVVMTVSEIAEQRLTGRPDSYVPARVFERLGGLPARSDGRSTGRNLAMHVGQGVVAGLLRSLMANVGLRGPVASASFTVVRLTNDQILENATGVGAPPQTWPRSELMLDLLHKTVYGFTTGIVADALAAKNGLGPGQRHAAMVPGRHADVGQIPRELAAGSDAG
jgi:hypothetical protein